VVAKVRERFTVSKQTTHSVHMQRFNVKKLNEVEGKEEYRVEIANRFPALENLDTEVDVNRVWQTVRISKFLPKRVQVIMNGSMKDAQNY
jgi:hypothetical protein